MIPTKGTARIRIIQDSLNEEFPGLPAICTDKIQLARTKNSDARRWYWLIVHTDRLSQASWIRIESATRTTRLVRNLKSFCIIPHTV